MRVVTRVELEAHRRDRAPAGEIDGDVHPLPGVEERPLDLPGRIQQAAVGAEQTERNQTVAIAKREQQPARVAGVQDLEPHPARRHDPLRVELAVDERTVAEPAVQAVLGGRRIGSHAAAADADVRDGEREPVAGREAERRIDRVVVLVRHDQQSGETTVDLLGGEAVRMGMKPVQAGPVLHLEAHALARARRDRIEARPVLRFRERQSVEMDGSGLRERVLDRGVEDLAAARDEDRLRDLA